MIISDKIVGMSGFQDIDGERIRALRRERMISQLELSKTTGIGQATLSVLERGVRQARPRTVRKLAEALGVEPTELIKSDNKSRG